ncbi:MAG TPA: FRG domain-containing protein [bacterium]|nr:FRG domain-containing protein [bacterium]
MPPLKALSDLPARLETPQDFYEFLTLYDFAAEGEAAGEFVFRGHHHAARSDLSTSLMRTTCAKQVDTATEQAVLARFRGYAASLIPHHFNMWDILAMAQHHGVPTRLLDWTSSPLIALHFAIRHREQKTDGVVWVADPTEFNAHAPQPLQDALTEEGLLWYTTALLGRVCPTVEAFDALAGDGTGRREFALFLEPPSYEARIANQFSLFSVTSAPALDLGAALPDGPDNGLKRVEVDAAMAPFIRLFLDQNNVTERILFPGLDGIAEYLKRTASDHFPLGSCEPEEVD